MSLKSQSFAFIIEQAKNLSVVLGVIALIVSGLTAIGLVPITPSTAEDMITQAIKENDQEWQKKIEELKQSIANSTANNGGKILRNQQDLQKIDRTTSQIDERTRLMFELMKDMKRN